PEFNLSPGKLDNECDLADRLTPALQDQTCRRFNVCTDWLNFGAGPLLHTALLDRDIDTWLALLECQLQIDPGLTLIVCRTRDVEIEHDPHQGAALVLRWSVGEVGREPVYAYQPVFSVCRWSDHAAHFLAIRALLAAYAVGVHLMGATIPEHRIPPLLEAREWPAVIFRNGTLNSWYPEDYVVGPTSGCAKGLAVRNWVLRECQCDGSLPQIREAQARIGSDRRSDILESAL
ncbi:MAG: hypothetical protein Q8K78_06615, partial [Planctomycetaceae bacterium]|nr:hypothetical protein [Planctomycetaceae bacterium]